MVTIAMKMECIILDFLINVQYVDKEGLWLVYREETREKASQNTSKLARGDHNLVGTCITSGMYSFC